MIKSLNNLGHHASAVAGSVIHARTKSMAKLRTAAAGTLFAGVFLMSTTNLAMAQQTLQDYAGTVSGKTNVVVDIVSYICYIAGAGLSALGIVDLKKHVENPTQTPLKNGIAKLGFGGILLALPFVSGVMVETMRGNGQAQYDGFNRGGMQIR